MSHSNIEYFGEFQSYSFFLFVWFIYLYLQLKHLFVSTVIQFIHFLYIIAQNLESDKEDVEGKKKESDNEDGAEKKDIDSFDDVKKKESNISFNVRKHNDVIQNNDSKPKLFEPGNSTYYDSDDSIDSYILKSIMEENCFCSVCSGTCKCPPGKCECSYCSPPTP